MNLTEAVASGRNFRRVSVGGEYLSYEDFQDAYGLEREDVLATDYELAPEVELSMTEAAFAEAWNRARGSFTTVKAAGSSPFYTALLNELRNL